MLEALAFLTPLGGARRPTPGALRWFPVVGAALGLALGGIWWLVGRAWPPLAAAGIVVVADLALTGLLHLDGLVDTADGLLPPLPRERRLAVMRQPDAGAFGIGAAGAVLILRWAALASIRPAPLLLGGLWCLSRTAMAACARGMPYARAEGGIASAFGARSEEGVPGGPGADRRASVRRIPLLYVVAALGAAGLAAAWVGSGRAGGRGRGCRGLCRGDLVGDASHRGLHGRCARRRRDGRRDRRAAHGGGPLVRARPLAVAAGVSADLAFGEPPLRPHPLTVFGRVMGTLERHAYADRRSAGVLHALVGVAIGVGAGAGLRSTAAATYLAVAERALGGTAMEIAATLQEGELEGARALLPQLVGRETSGLDEKEVARAVVESVAENTVDAVVAPACWAVARRSLRCARLPRRQHARRHGRAPQRPLRTLRLGERSPGRPGQLRARTIDGRARRRGPPECRRGGPAGGARGRTPAPVSQRRRGRGGLRRRPRAPARWDESLRRARRGATVARRRADPPSRPTSPGRSSSRAE